MGSGMGAGSSKKHEVFSVAPSATISSATSASGGGDGVGGVGGWAIGEVPAAGVEALDHAHELIDEVVSAPFHGAYDTYAAEVLAAKDALAEAASAGAPAYAIAEEKKALVDAAKAQLEGLNHDELCALAAAQGFEHPWLVGAETPAGKAHPLVFWLNPAYDQDIPQKIAVQDKALARWQELQAGGTYAGMTLASYSALHPPAGADTLSPEELTALRGEIDQLPHPYAVPNDEKAALWWKRRTLTHRYQSATCSDPDFVKEPLAYSPVAAGVPIDDLATVVSANSDLTPLQVVLLQEMGVDHLLWGTSDQKATAEKALANRSAALDALSAHAAEFGAFYGPGGDVLTLPALWSDPAAAAETASWLKAAGSLKTVVADASSVGYGSHALQASLKSATVGELLGPHVSAAATAVEVVGPSYYTEKTVAKSFRAWAKDQKIGDLRALAEELGMDATTAKGLTRAQLQNFALGHLSASAQATYEKSAAQTAKWKAAAAEAAAAAATLPKKITPNPKNALQTMAAKKAAAAEPPAQPGPAIVSSSTKGKGFAEKRAAMAAGLAHMAAAMAVTGDRPTVDEVKGLNLSETAAPVHGGVHTKKFFKDEKGRVWMFKPTVPSRAEAEQAAAELFHRAGLPSVPVVAHKVGGKAGSIQPIVPHTGTIDPHPGSWTQADVDAMVRIHVASWMVGDHDGKADNLLRTPGGGILAIDQGQAWKFVGRDRLDVDYHPNSSFGVSPPVYHQAYKAAKGGKLAAGVKVRPEAAVPVIAAFEAIPDNTLRTMMRPLAERGVADQLEWLAPMRDKAKKAYKTTSPTPKQIADTFIEQVVERKKNLRKDFVTFFSGLGFDGADNVAEVAA